MRGLMAKFASCAKSDPAWFLFLLFAFLSMLSLPLARAALLCSLVFAIRGRRLRMAAPAWGAAAYFALAVVVTASVAIVNSPFGVAHGLCGEVDIYIEPLKGLRKTTKLLWYVSIPLAASLVTSRERFASVAKAWLAGGTALALFICLANPVLAFLQIHWHPDSAFLERLLSDPVWARTGGRPPSFHLAMSYLGTMHDAQRLMVALACGACAVATAGRERRGLGGVVAAMAAIALALVVTCKRGPLIIGLGIAFVTLAATFKPWKLVPFALLAVCVAFALPVSRARLADLPGELSMARGGRALMWTRVVPALHREYPHGLGFRSLTALKMHNADWHVEKGRTHVHSVPLQAFVDFGWPGVAVWLFWMALAFRCALRATGAFPPLSPMPLCVLAALVLFGIFEYNIADAAVVPLYGIAMGLAASDAAKGEKHDP